MSDEMIGLKGLTEPVTKLIEAVRAGVGCLYTPRHIRNVAKAKAEEIIILADAKAKETEILAKADAKAMDIQARAKERVERREIRRQENIEAVIETAILQLPHLVDRKSVNPDWTAAFFDYCQDVSDEQMQTVWAKLLAGEVARPGTYSLRTLALVKVLRAEEAHLFTRFCTYVWETEDSRVPFILTRPGFRKIACLT